MQRSRILIIVVSVCALIALTAVVLWPQPKPAAASHVAAVSAGGQHTCALTTSGGVQCWGRNHYGQLGNGTPGDSTTPVDVVGLETGVVAIASGGAHTCALTIEGGVQCWGANKDGRLGNGLSGLDDEDVGIISSTPVEVVGLKSGILAIAAGFAHTCALTAEGGVKCWGSNYFRQLGRPVSSSCIAGPNGYQIACSPTPIDVLDDEEGGPIAGLVAITAGRGDHTCALTTVGGVKCWGHNKFGQLGTGGAPSSAVDVEGLGSAVASVAAGAEHTCVLTDTGGVKCWGFNHNGQLGNGETGFSLSPTPQDVLGLETGVAAISPGGLHTCALLVTGGVKCWGFNFFGQVGDGTAVDRLTPVDVLGLSSGVVAVSAGDLHTCALIDTGGVSCWGAENVGNFGQTGDSDGDGCTDFAEHGSIALLGGQRDHLDYWDFFDTPNASNYRDRRIDILDIGAVVARFGAVGEVEGDPLSPPPPAPAYHTAFDRGGPVPGEKLWNLLPADGSINIIDIGAMIVQFGHTCA